jgi:hypothetical protein
MSAPVSDSEAFMLLAPGFDPPLAGWYATPVARARAVELHAESHQAEQRALAGAGDASLPRLARLVATYWLDGSVELDYRSLAVTLPPARRALVELIYGQLLISRKRVGALEHLRRGFTLAAPALAPADYFALLRRHELLQSLVLTAAGFPPQDLPDLLNEARIVRQFGPGGAPRPAHKPDDTLG